jgi:trehalose 6-phosphate synthase
VLKSSRISTTGPLLVASNRLPYNLPRENRPLKRNVGGLVNALEPVMAARGGAWVGWDGIQLPSAGAVNTTLSHPRKFRTPSGVELHGVPLSDKEVSRYYHGFSNRTLWPLLHDFSDKAVYNPEDFNAYVCVNRRFAEIIRSKAKPRSHLWIHDFHLMLVPQFLRELGFNGRIDFFLHIPFPTTEMFRKLPWRAELLRGLLASDTVAFHVEPYRDNFVESTMLLCGTQGKGPDREGVTTLKHGERRTRVLAAPIGIDVDDFEKTARKDSVRARARRMKYAHKDCRVLFSADRLDYTKGIRERLRSLEHFLKTYPDAVGKVSLTQIVVPGRSQVEEFRLMKREIDQEVGRINGEYGREGWLPIHYR